MAKSTSKLFESEEPKEMKEDAMNLPEEVKEDVKKETIPEEQTEVVTTPPVSDGIVDVDISSIRRKRFRINGDSSKIIELNTSDMNISTRLQDAYNKLQKHMEKVGDILSDIPDEKDAELTEEQQENIKSSLHDIDVAMKKEVDYIFDAPVSDACCDGGSMYDPFEGMFRYEHIIEALLKLYERNLENEFAKMRRRVSAKTSKYTKKYHN